MKNKILNGYKISKKEALNLVFNAKLEDLLSDANEIRQHFCGDKFNLCAIINVKSGGCSEDCAYCAQSSYFKTNSPKYPLLDSKTILKSAKYHNEKGVHRFSLVASGRGLTKSKKIEEIYNILDEQTSLHLCGSFGIVGVEILENLKKSGLKTYHHNLETSRNFYPKICTTHSYDDRIQTIENAKSVGLDVCSGAIFGMGESMEDRIDLAFELRNLEVSSVPLNILTPIPGTPLQNQPPLPKDEILRTMAIFRFILPNVFLRYAGGRNNLGEFVEIGLKGGVNSALTGDFLTTKGDAIENDIKMARKLGFSDV
ncbi:biotin synthase BioB [Campylobacter sp. FMV-PI01]|uniref:Biotin synthase n=1 Tax=Campylobacter portucalensis TaxID=2608384 RepID=A0A6L5WH41_9BACT|nr:biotin synthase BioB [Campylobacter portucalensis]MSN96354.1 biotin synthase BioB [Campylobacter portucalensis]